MSERMLLPRLGETMETGKVAAWLVQPGNRFRRGETIVEIESDKTVVELPALQNGVLTKIIAEAGSEVAVGEVLCLIDIEGDGDSTSFEAPPLDTEPQSHAETPVSLAESVPLRLATLAQAVIPGRLRATPKARHLARDLNIDLSSVVGTGRRGRIEARDLPTQGPAVTTDDVRITPTPGGALAWRYWGDAGAPTRFVLIHGFAGDSKSWSKIAAMLARQGCYVLAPDPHRDRSG
jgi:pyruvate/2-oxoglutarate dehydrogenase complex dihydrolipoamide acyltransferase (E2) component